VSVRVVETAIPAVLLLAVLARAVLGPPPATAPARTRIACVALLAGAADVLAAILMLKAHPLSTWAAFAGAAGGSWAMWLARTPGHGGGGGGGDDGGEPPVHPSPDGPVEWDAFDAARAGWRPRARA
jgi:hypothetical protein